MRARRAIPSTQHRNDVETSDLFVLSVKADQVQGPWLPSCILHLFRGYFGSVLFAV